MDRLLIVVFAVLAAVTPAPAQSPQTPPAGETQARMRLWSAALGVQCTHCHAAGGWSDGSKPAYEFAQRMHRMVDAVNAGPLKDVEAITCWTCHRGQTRPARLPRTLWEGIQSAHAADFAAAPDRSLAMSVYAASLGVDCAHCHEPGNWATAATPAHAMVAKMLPIFDEIPKHFDQGRMPQTQCYMCHQGARIPQRRPPL